MSNDEPEYLKALKDQQARRKNKSTEEAPSQAGSRKSTGPTPAEREAVRWAHEVGGKDIVVAGSVAGAKCAILLHPITPFGAPRITLEGLPSREALAARIQAAVGAGENVLGCFELTTGRSLTPATAEGKVTFTGGAPRSIPKSESPERMIRKAAAQAALLAKTRKVDDRRGGDRGGRGR